MFFCVAHISSDDICLASAADACEPVSNNKSRQRRQTETKATTTPSTLIRGESGLTDQPFLPATLWPKPSAACAVGVIAPTQMAC